MSEEEIIESIALSISWAKKSLKNEVPYLANGIECSIINSASLRNLTEVAEMMLTAYRAAKEKK